MCKLVSLKLKTYAALSEDINNGWVWLPESIVTTRNTVKISNLATRKSVFCEALPAGDNYLKRHAKQAGYKIEDKSSAIIINEWYRTKLGIIKTQEIEHLEIVPCDNLCGQLRASLEHPQNIIRIASKLGILSVVLGILGICLGLKGAC